MFRAYRRRLPSLITIAGFAMLWGVTLLTPRGVGSTSSAQTPGASDDKPAGQVFKNIQVLREVPASQLNLAMDFMAASLGVGCDFCHTSDMSSDEKSTKATTRQMLLMTADINKQSFSGFSVVNCYTCHRGRTEPVSIPELDESILRGESESKKGSLPGLPAADLLIARYEDAIGGLEAIRKVTTCSFAGFERRYLPGDPSSSAAVKIYHKAPDKFLYDSDLPDGPLRRGFDGKSQWDRRGNRVLSAERKDQDPVERESADFYWYLKLKEAFPTFRVLGREKLANRDVIVAGAASPGGAKVKLYFDAASGLLVRRAGQIKTPLGPLPDIVDFEDYRKVNGIAFPFRIKRSRPPAIVVQEFTEIKVNRPIDDSQFSAPPASDRADR
jgi:hypothetical protein